MRRNTKCQSDEVRERTTKSNKSKGRSQKPAYQKEGASEKRDPKSLDTAGRDNDPNWYISDKTLAEQVCHLSFNSFIGEGNIIGTQYAVPSIVRVSMNPSPFNSYDIIDPNDYTQIKRSGLNLAITKLYTLLASYSGRAASYAPQDVGAILLAMGEIVSMVEDMRRVVGVSYTFSERNRALPKLLTHALGYDYDDFINNRAIYINRLNAIITRFNSLPILGNVAYILKCRDLFQKVYTDSMSPEATLIVNVPNSTWELDETSYAGGTILKTVSWNVSGGVDTFGNKLVKLDSMVEALFGSSTLNVIYADLLNLASKVKVDMFKLDYVTEDYIVIPEYNANFLLQLHNADIVGEPNGASLQTIYGTMQGTPYNDVYPDAGSNGLIYNPYWLVTYTGQTKHYGSIVDLPDSDPSVENIIESTRFKVESTAHYTVGTDYVMTCAALPDHYVTGIWVWSNQDSVDSSKCYVNNWLDASMGASYILSVLSAHSQIDWAPIIYYQDFGVGNPIQALYGDLNFYTPLMATTLMAMNRIIAQDLFDFKF